MRKLTLPGALGFSADRIARMHQRASMEDWLRLNQRDLEDLALRDPTAVLENPFRKSRPPSASPSDRDEPDSLEALLRRF